MQFCASFFCCTHTKTNRKKERERLCQLLKTTSTRKSIEILCFPKKDWTSQKSTCAHFSCSPRCWDRLALTVGPCWPSGRKIKRFFDRLGRRRVTCHDSNSPPSCKKTAWGSDLFVFIHFKKLSAGRLPSGVCAEHQWRPVAFSKREAARPSSCFLQKPTAGAKPNSSIPSN